MQIQINTDGSIKGDERLKQHVEAVVTDALDRFGPRITRVEVHLRDANSDQKAGGHDKRCLLEARLAGRKPTAVSHEAATMEQALHGATDKLVRALDKSLGRAGKHP